MTMITKQAQPCATANLTPGGSMVLRVRFDLLARIKILFGWTQRVIVSVGDANAVNIPFERLERS